MNEVAFLANRLNLANQSNVKFQKPLIGCKKIGSPKTLCLWTLTDVQCCSNILMWWHTKNLPKIKIAYICLNFDLTRGEGGLSN